MKGNSISAKPLNESGKTWLEKTLQLLKVQEYGKGSVRNYMQELTLLFKYYNELQIEALRPEHIERYFVFIKENRTVEKHLQATPTKPAPAQSETSGRGSGDDALWSGHRTLQRVQNRADRTNSDLH